MVEKEVEIKNKVGLHARPASVLVNVASKFKSRITIEKDRQQANGKSIMSILLLAAERGSKIKIRAEGPDEKEAVQTLSRLVEERFGEE